MPASTLPTGRTGQLLAVAITLAILLVLWLALASPLIGFYERRAVVVQHRLEVASHMRALADALPDLRAEAADAAKSGPPPVVAIEGGSDAVAAATLQNLVQDMASEAGANLQSVEIVQAQTVGDYRRIGIKLSLGTPWPVLLDLLRQIARSAPPMLIDDLEIHATPGIPGARDPALETTLTVYGFRPRAAGDQPT